MINDYKKYMKKCISLAKKGEGFVSPNPVVGAIVLDEKGDIVGLGYHQKYGDAHAEVNALNMAGDKAKNGTIIVNLEPCSHFGKTPPCSDLIIKKGLKRLVVGTLDPNPKVSGSGIKNCKDAGIEVITCILEHDCNVLNEVFFKNQMKKKPFIAIKTAITLDGKIASKTGSSKWITSEKSRNHVQKLRNKYDAILTGSNTVLTDNPSLTCRLKNKKNPARIVIDSKLITNPDNKIYNDDGTKVYIAVSKDISEQKKSLFPSNIEFIECPLKNQKIDLNYLTDELFKKGISSILVEAGGILNGAFLKENIVDKIYQFSAPKVLGDKDGKNWVEGLNITEINECLNLKKSKVLNLAPDTLTEYYF